AGATRVQISAKIDTNDSVIMDVFNNGTPISKESQEEIFVPFYTTKASGSGIGLSLSRQMMRLHDGNLRLLRSDEKGTIFQLIFK
ncbi:MAG: sensor histidine kinase, partial [Bacteroidales bacterium]|nr:sensor histidine kinase [Bacteroidales bacterium]